MKNMATSLPPKPAIWWIIQYGVHKEGQYFSKMPQRLLLIYANFPAGRIKLVCPLEKLRKRFSRHLMGRSRFQMIECIRCIIHFTTGHSCRPTGSCLVQRTHCWKSPWLKGQTGVWRRKMETSRNTYHPWKRPSTEAIWCKLPASYKRLVDELKQNWQRMTGQPIIYHFTVVGLVP